MVVVFEVFDVHVFTVFAPLFVDNSSYGCCRKRPHRYCGVCACAHMHNIRVHILALLICHRICVFAVYTVITFGCVLSSALITAGADVNVKNKNGVTCLCAYVLCDICWLCRLPLFRDVVGRSCARCCVFRCTMCCIRV
jgi:hypothetical protein